MTEICKPDMGDAEITSFSGRLKKLLDVSNTLATCPDLDTLCRRAVELGRSELGFDRLGVWFRTDDPLTISGMYGTDEQGRIRDEHHKTVKIDTDRFLMELQQYNCACILRRDGTLYDDSNQCVGHGSWACAPVWDGHEVVGYVMTDNLLHHREITEQQRELLALFAATIGHLSARKRFEEALRQSEQTYRMTLDSMDNAIHVVDRDLRIVLCNRMLREWLSELGLHQDLLHRSVFDVFSFLPPKIREEYEQVFRSGKMILTEDEVTLGDTVISTETRKIPIFENEQVVRVVTVIRDIREQKQALQALKQSELQLRQSQKMEALGRLAGGIAHDFNNLLTSIMGYSQLVMDQLDTQSPLHDEMSEVVQAGRRAADMTARLLSFGRRQPVNVRTIDVNPVIQETEHLLQHTLEDNIELTTLLGDDLGGVMIDEGHLQQLVMNLVINARDSMPAGGRIVVETSRHNRTQPDGHMIPEMAPGEYVCLTVSDSGSGMTDEVREHIFEPFFTTKEKEKGSGLGLAIVYGLVKQSNGHIRVISQPGQGSVFEIYFPRQHQVSSPEAPTPQEHLRRGHETVLVVEDEKSVRHFAVNVFKSLGYRTLQAGNGNEAMLIFNKFGGEIDLLFTDIVMPGMNGHELVNCLREHGYHFRALYASGFSGDLLDDPHAEAKIPLLSKPYTRDELGRMIACVFETQ